PPALGAFQVAQVGHQQQVLLAGEQVVHRRELAGDTDDLAHRVRVPGQVVAADGHLAGVGTDQGGQDLDHGGLAGPVGPQQREDRPLGDLEIDAAEDDLVAEGLAQSGDRDRGPTDGTGHVWSFPGSAATERLMVMAPKEVRAGTSTARAAGAGRSVGPRSLWTLPKRVLRSSQAATPSRIPISTLPKAVSASTVPCATWPRRTSPLADFAATVSHARSTEILPLAAFTRRFPVISPIQGSPLGFLTTAGPWRRWWPAPLW